MPTFVPITRPYRGCLIAGMRAATDGEVLFEGYACDYHKAALRSYSYIVPPMVGRYRPGRPSRPIGTRRMAPGSTPARRNLLRGRYARTSDETCGKSPGFGSGNVTARAHTLR
jgi:hypothetical protein